VARAEDRTLDVGDARERLREVALDRFGRNGAKATTTREIVVAAGLRNPSAIHYYFGSKDGLVEDLTTEFRGTRAKVLQQQVDLAAQAVLPTHEEWAGVVVDYSATLLATDRGCLLVRIWAEYDDLHPEVTEEFLAGSHPLAVAWRAAIATVFPELPVPVAVARNVVALRTAQWITHRLARRILDNRTASSQTDAARAWLRELLVNLLAPPTHLTADHIARL
jgi:AcrR family transcriptional regulator